MPCKSQMHAASACMHASSPGQVQESLQKLKKSSGSKLGFLIKKQKHARRSPPMHTPKKKKGENETDPKSIEKAAPLQPSR